MPDPVRLGGTVTSLTTAGLVLGNGGDMAQVSAGATSYQFGGTYVPGSSYAVTVAQQPTGATCTVSNDTGTFGLTDVTNANVVCTLNVYPVAVTLVGYASSGLVLRNNGVAGSEVAAGSTMAGFMAEFGAAYDVQVATQPLGQTCMVTDGVGMVMVGGNSVTVACMSDLFSLGGAVTGLTESGLVLGTTGADDVTVDATDTRYELQLPFGLPYQLAVRTQPAGQTCAVANATGTQPAMAVTNADVTCTNNPYRVGGTLVGVVTAGLELSLNGGPVLAPLANDTTFTFPEDVPFGSAYSVTVVGSPVGFGCAASASSGTVGAANVTDVVVTCTAGTFPVVVSIADYIGTGLALSLDGVVGGPLASGATSESFLGIFGQPFSVAVAAQPDGQVCTVVGTGMGTVAATGNSVAIQCVSNTYTVGGTLTGLGNTGLQLTLGAQTVSPASGATTFTFGTALAFGSAYAVAIGQQPTAYTCTLANASGTVGAGPVTNVAVTCTVNSYPINVAIAGYTSTGLSLANNGNAGDVLASGSTSTSFTANFGNAFAITVATQPVGQACTVAGTGAGTVAVTGNAASVNCVNNTYTVGGTISGLGNTGLQLTLGAQTVSPASGATAFAFGTAVAFGSSYAVAIGQQPTGYTCTLANASGTVGAGPVTNVAVTCTVNSYPINVAIAGYTSTGLRLANNGTAGAVLATGSTTTSFTATFGTAFAITVATQPVGQTCTVAGTGAGTVAVSGNAASVNCVNNTYTVGGTISGLGGTGLRLTLGAQMVSPASGATTFTFGTAVAFGSAYAVAVGQQPTGYTCTLANASGTVGAGPVTNVAVTCSVNSYPINVAIAGYTSTGLRLANNGTAGAVLATGSTTTSFTANFGTAFAITVATQPVGQTCTVAGTGAGTVAVSGNAASVNCTTNIYTVGGTITGLVFGGLQLALNGVTVQSIPSGATTFTFSPGVQHGTAYTISVAAPADHLLCTLGNATGTATGAVTNVSVSCTQVEWPVGGTVANLTSAGLSLLLNTSSGLTVADSNTSFVFPQFVATGATYNVIIAGQPAADTCTLSGSSGVMPAGPVTSVVVSCTPRAPYVVTSAPLEQSVRTPATLSTIRVDFSRAMDPASLSTVVFTGTPGALDLPGAAWSLGNTRVEIPVAGLSAGLTYTVNLSGLLDATGAPLDPVPYLVDGILTFRTFANSEATVDLNPLLAAVDGETGSPTFQGTWTNDLGGVQPINDVPSEGVCQGAGRDRLFVYRPTSIVRALTVDLQGTTTSDPALRMFKGDSQAGCNDDGSPDASDSRLTVTQCFRAGDEVAILVDKFNATSNWLASDTVRFSVTEWAMPANPAQDAVQTYPDRGGQARPTTELSAAFEAPLRLQANSALVLSITGPNPRSSTVSLVAPGGAGAVLLSNDQRTLTYIPTAAFLAGDVVSWALTNLVFDCLDINLPPVTGQFTVPSTALANAVTSRTITGVTANFKPGRGLVERGGELFFPITNAPNARANPTAANGVVRVPLGGGAVTSVFTEGQATGCNPDGVWVTPTGNVLGLRGLYALTGAGIYELTSPTTCTQRSSAGAGQTRAFGYDGLGANILVTSGLADNSATALNTVFAGNALAATVNPHAALTADLAIGRLASANGVAGVAAAANRLYVFDITRWATPLLRVYALDASVTDAPPTVGALLANVDVFEQGCRWVSDSGSFQSERLIPVIATVDSRVAPSALFFTGWDIDVDPTTTNGVNHRICRLPLGPLGVPNGPAQVFAGSRAAGTVVDSTNATERRDARFQFIMGMTYDQANNTLLVTQFSNGLAAQDLVRAVIP